MSSAGYAPASKQHRWVAQRLALQSWMLRHVSAARPPRASSVLRLFESLRLRRKYAGELRALVARAQRLTPGVADRVATLVRIDPDAALETFFSAFQQQHFELDESVVDQGFEFWADGNAEFIPVLMRGTDRCNGIEPLGYRPGYALQWALIQDVFYADERSQVIAEVANAFGPEIADRLESAQPPEHHVLCRRLGRSPYRGLVAFSRWALGDVLFNPVLYHHAHHADELRIRWTTRGVRRATRLVRTADDFQAPILALARWIEEAPADHGRRVVDAVIGHRDRNSWTRDAIQPCDRCGFPPEVDTWHDAVSEDLFYESTQH